MGGVNRESGPKYNYYSLKTKAPHFEVYVKDSDPIIYDGLENVLLEKVGRRKKKLSNGGVFWEYCVLLSDLSDEGAKIIMTVPNFGDVLLRVFGPLMSLDSIPSLDFSPYKANGKYFRMAIRAHGEKETIKYPYAWDGDDKWFKGVPRVVWTEKEDDGIVTNESDDSALKAFILKELSQWCNVVLGVPFEEAEVGERIFSNSTASTSSASTSVKDIVAKFIPKVLNHYKDFNVLADDWLNVVDRAKKAIGTDDDMDLSFFFVEFSRESKAHYDIIHDVKCSAVSIDIEEVEIVNDDLPF